MAIFPDQLGKKIDIAKPPRRIVSLVPSQTELLAYLELDKEVIGITKFCVHPGSWFQSKQKIGGTKALHIDQIKALAPGLVIANKEENLAEEIYEIEKDFPVWTSDVKDIESAFQMMSAIGEITGKESKAVELINSIKNSFKGLETFQPFTACYLIWRDPYMTVGSDCFIHAMMALAGFKNVYADQTRYPSSSISEIKDRNPDLVLLSSEPFPFQDKHREELKSAGINSRILPVDGEMFSWYGSRMLFAADYFRKLRKQMIDEG
jgi:ABC-type Fe3+-hydroxamate transport system substrate-binding protein